jgi:hypothetical protein
VLQIRLCDEDRAAYGGPEWLVFDPERIRDLPVEELEEMEEASLISIGSMLDIVESTGDIPTTARFRRAAAWIALHCAGEEMPWGKFTPRILRAQVRRQAGPPDGGPSADSSAAAASEPSPVG